VNLNDLIQKNINIGYKRIDAISKVSQDIVLSKISKSNFKNNITIKGGVVMHNISNDIRRATRDLDLDFIKYSLEDSCIKNFISRLNQVNDGIEIQVIGNIIKLHHQDYDGKRVNIRLKDNNNNIIDTKLDIGVHKLFDIEQDNYCFDLNVLNENVSLLINSKEQIFAEKLKSLLKFGIRSTRYKDIFDFYYLINNCNINKEKLIKYISIIIFNDETMREKTMLNIIERISTITHNKSYKEMLNQAQNNWLDLSVDEVIESVIEYLRDLTTISV